MSLHTLHEVRCTTVSTCRRSLHGRVSYQPRHLLLIRRLYSRSCKLDVVTLSLLSHYGLLRFCGKRSDLKRTTNPRNPARSTRCGRPAGNGAVLIVSNRLRHGCRGRRHVSVSRSALVIIQLHPIRTNHVGVPLSLTQRSSPPPPSLYVFNAQSVAKPHVNKQLTVELLSYGINVAVISETHLEKKHVDSCVTIDEYVLFRHDRPAREGGGVAINVRQSFKASTWTSPGLIDPFFELLWVKVNLEHDVTFVGALHHPPAHLYVSADLLDLVETRVLGILREFPEAHVVLTGDLNTLPESEVVARTGLSPIVFQPTSGWLEDRLDRIYVSDQQYSSVKVVKSAVESDAVAIVAFADGVVLSVGKTRRVCSFTKHTPAQHAFFLASITEPVHHVNPKCPAGGM